MSLDKKLTAAQERAAKDVYQKQFEIAFRRQLQDLADVEAERAARAIAKDPAFREQLRKKVKAILKRDLDTFVEAAMKDASICW